MDSMINQFLRGDYMPHGHCYLWQPHILWTHVVSDLLIATAYFSIPYAIMLFLQKRRDIGYEKVFILFSLFILFCGITHLFGIWTIWQGVYGYHGIAKALTALVSVATAFYLYKLLPDLLRVPTVAQLEGIKTQIGQTKKENRKLTGLLEGHNQTKWMLDSLPLSFILANENGQIDFVNQHFSEEFGLANQTLAETISGNTTEFDNIIETNGDSLELNESINFVGQVNTDRHNKNVEITITRKQYEDNIQLLVTLKDLREVATLKQELVESNSRFEQAIAATNDGIWNWNVQTGEQVWSPQLFELIGLSKSEKPSYEKWFSHIHPTFKEIVQSAVDVHLQLGEKYEVEYLGLNQHGKYGWFLTRGDSTFDENGAPIMMSGSLRYIDEERRAKRLLDERTQFLEALYMGTNHAIWVIELKDNDFKFTTYNNTALKWTGITKEQIIDKKLSELDFFSEQVKTHLFEKYNACVEQNQPIEYVECIPFDDEPHWYQTSLYPIKKYNIDKCSYIIGTAVDITAQKQAQNQLAVNHAFLENLLDSSVCGFYIFDLTTMHNERINSTYTELLGYTLEDLQQDTDLMAKFHPDEQQVVLEHMQQVAQSKEGEKFQLEYRFKHKDGHWVWCYSVDSILARDDEGNPTKMLGTFVDVSVKNDLLLKLKESNDYLEQFAFVASHDLQEPLRKITAFSESIHQRLKSQFTSDPDSAYELDRLKLAAKRLSKMIEDLLKLSRINSNVISLESEKLGNLITTVLEGLELKIESTGAEISVTNGELEINADVGLFEQVLQNLVSNSIKFAQDNQQPIITINADDLGTWTEITVSDNGIGIATDHVQRIFEPFKRLHSREKYEGSGIGLAIVDQIIKVHGGTIKCISREGQGTTFIIRLPNER